MIVADSDCSTWKNSDHERVEIPSSEIDSIVKTMLNSINHFSETIGAARLDVRTQFLESTDVSLTAGHEKLLPSEIRSMEIYV